jgi:hypothetical protein
MFMAKNILDLDISKQQVMLFDNFPNGPYEDLIKSAFSPNFPLLRHKDYLSKTMLFKKLVFHLESPAALIFPEITKPNFITCHDSSLFREYRNYIFQAFDLLNQPPPPIPEVTLVLRKRTADRNTGRILENESEVVALLKRGNVMNLNVVDLSEMSFREQLKVS